MTCGFETQTANQRTPLPCSKDQINAIHKQRKKKSVFNEESEVD